jgi:2-C-methyl-D-erythritol 4-phosphate cytidylyltransferase
VRLGVVVVAAGRGERLGDRGPKALVPLAGRPLLVHSLVTLARAGLPPPVVVHAPGHLDDFFAAVGDVEVAAFVAGGATRTASVRAGVAALSDDVDVVAVHDAARPLVPVEAIGAAVAALQDDEVAAAAPGTPVADTLKRVGPAAADGSSVVLTNVDRRGLVAVQTPQVVRRALLERALDGPDATDELGSVQALLDGASLPGRIVVVPSSPRGRKVTVPDDLRIAAALLAGPA